MNAPTARELRDRLRPHAEAIVSELAPTARKQGNRFVLGSIAGEAGYSLHIRPNGDWIDRANPSDSGDILAFVREVVCNGDSKAAYRWALDFLGEETTSRRREIPTLIEPTQPKHTTLSMSRRLTWAHAKPITAEDPAGKYLLSRGCMLPHPDGDLRWVAEHEHPSGHTGPALIGLITDVRDASRQLSLHQSWIAGDGSSAKAFDHLNHLPKHQRPSSRLYLLGHPKKGGCVRLWPDDAVTVGLGVGEGIETCLTLAHEITPVWALLDAGGLGKLPYLRPIECITVAADNDEAGEKAFASLSGRWSAAGAEVIGVTTEKAGSDLNDFVETRRYG